MRNETKHTSLSHHGYSRDHPAFPHANGFNGFLRALPGESGFLVTVIGGFRRIGPVRADIAFRQLDASVEASGPHDFVVRKMTRSSVAPPASTASRTYVRDDRETPLMWDGTRESLRLFLPGCEAEYFCPRGWTAQVNKLPVGQISMPGRSASWRLF